MPNDSSRSERAASWLERVLGYRDVLGPRLWVKGDLAEYTQCMPFATCQRVGVGTISHRVTWSIAYDMSKHDGWYQLFATFEAAESGMDTTDLIGRAPAIHGLGLEEAAALLLHDHLELRRTRFGESGPATSWTPGEALTGLRLRAVLKSVWGPAADEAWIDGEPGPPASE